MDGADEFVPGYSKGSWLLPFNLLFLFPSILVGYIFLILPILLRTHSKRRKHNRDSIESVMDTLDSKGDRWWFLSLSLSDSVGPRRISLIKDLRVSGDPARILHGILLALLLFQSLCWCPIFYGCLDKPRFEIPEDNGGMFEGFLAVSWGILSGWSRTPPTGNFSCLARILNISQALAR